MTMGTTETARTVRDLELGQTARVTKVGGEGSLRQHFLDMGIIPGARVTLVKYAPMGDPLELRIHGYELTLRLADAGRIEVCDVRDGGAASDDAVPLPDEAEDDHPGLGEGGIFHEKATEHPLPDGTTLTFALAGNQNCGKTTLFNQLTGSNQHVGNFPGVTVEAKNGPIKGHPNTLVTDLPGIYSLSPYSAEEVVSRRFILDEHPTAIINIVDATNIERNLYLTMQLMELDVPLVIAVNMMDELRENGGSIRINEMERLLGVPVVPIAAVNNEGVDELVDHAIHIARFQERPRRIDFCGKDDRGGAVHRCLHGIMHLIEDHAERAHIPVRFAASKLIEGDPLVASSLNLDENEREAIEHIVAQMETESGLDRAAAIAAMRFSFIERVCGRAVVRPHESRGSERSRRIDRFLTGRYTGIPAFIGIMLVVFWLTFGVIGSTLQDLLAAGIDALAGVVDDAMAAGQVNEVVRSLVVDGIFSGVGSVLSFVPIIVTMFFFLSLLEDSGYLARVAFVMDKALRRIGLSGRSIVPMLIGFGCSVPAIMSTRTLPSERDRRMTVLLTPFMSCSAKLPIYTLLTAAFFPDHAVLVMALLYFGGIAVGVLCALVSKNTRFKGEAVPFVMELPNYRMPGLKSVGRLVWDKTVDFLERAFTIIFLATIVVWFLQTFDFSFAVVDDPQTSMLAVVSGFIAPVFAPLGFGDWRVSTALITGFLAKESVVSTLTVLFGSVEAIRAAFTPLAGASLLVFCLLYTPCVAAIASVKRELGGKWALWVVVFQCAIAWVAAFAIRCVGMLFGLA